MNDDEKRKQLAELIELEKRNLELEKRVQFSLSFGAFLFCALSYFYFHNWWAVFIFFGLGVGWFNEYFVKKRDANEFLERCRKELNELNNEHKTCSGK